MSLSSLHTSLSEWRWGRYYAAMRCFVFICGLALLMAASGVRAENPRVAIEITDFGTIEVELLPKLAPATVANFLRLVDASFYDGLIFHRVIANFMIQTGGFTPTMEHRETQQTVVNESRNGVRNARFTVAMARLDDPDSAGSQFFINVNNNTRLDASNGEPGYTVFGRVVDGRDVVEMVELVDTHIVKGMSAVPETPVVIAHIRRL